MKFLVSRYNPDSDSDPYMQEFDVDVTRGMMLRDALLEIKRLDELGDVARLRGESSQAEELLRRSLEIQKRAQRAGEPPTHVASDQGHIRIGRHGERLAQ